MSKKHSISTQLSPEYVLLGFLALSPSHGYEIHHRLQSELKHIWRLSLSQVYNVLSRLEKEGLIDGELERHRVARSGRIVGEGLGKLQ